MTRHILGVPLFEESVTMPLAHTKPQLVEAAAQCARTGVPEFVRTIKVNSCTEGFFSYASAIEFTTEELKRYTRTTGIATVPVTYGLVERPPARFPEIWDGTLTPRHWEIPSNLIPAARVRAVVAQNTLESLTVTPQSGVNLNTINTGAYFSDTVQKCQQEGTTKYYLDDISRGAQVLVSYPDPTKHIDTITPDMCTMVDTDMFIAMLSPFHSICRNK